MEGNFSADQRAKVVAVLYMVPGDLNGQFHAEKMGYHEMVLLRPQGAAEVVVLAAEFDNTHISSPASAHWRSSSLQRQYKIESITSQIVVWFILDKLTSSWYLYSKKDKLTLSRYT
ncbi:hypothetical protein CFC21_003326 [Triticum aestivum]|nr:hypothetical protein CFC21_003326 [Triticum aestivum]